MTRWFQPSPDRTTTAERIAAGHQAQQEAQARRDEVAKQTRSPMGIVRRRPDVNGAQEAINNAHRQVTDTLTGVADAIQRSRTLSDGEQGERDSDARRQPRSPR